MLDLTKVILFAIATLLFGCKAQSDLSKIDSGYTDINDVNHYYQFVGHGDTLIILHGGPGLSHQYMKPQLDELLSEHFTLLYYDQRGSGWTDGVQDTLNLNIEAYVRDLESLRKQFSFNKMNLLGHSFGGLLAMHYAIEFPNQVKSMVLVDTDAASYALRTPHQIKTIDERLTAQQLSFLDSIENTNAFKRYDPITWDIYYKTYLTSYFADPGDTEKLYLGFDSLSVSKIDHTNGMVRAALGNYDIHEALANVDCRTLIMQGAESVFSVEGAMAIHEQLDNSEIHVFENCGHFQYIEFPLRFKNLILDFYNVNQ